MCFVKPILALVFLATVPTTVTAKKLNLKPKLERKEVVDFDYHPGVHGVITYLGENEAEIFDIKNARSLMVIKNIVNSPMTATAWLRFVDNNNHQMMAIGFESGLVFIYAVDVRNGTYQLAKRLELDGTVDAIVARPVHSEKDTLIWSVTTAANSKKEPASVYVFSGYIKKLHQIFNGPRVVPPSFVANKDQGFESLAYTSTTEIYKGTFSTTLQAHLTDEEKSTMALGGKYAGLTFYPSKPELAVMGDAEANDDKARVHFFDVRKQAAIFSFPIHSQGAEVTALSFLPRALRNDTDDIVAVASGGGAIDFWHVDPYAETFERIGFVEPQMATVTKLYWLYTGGDDRCAFYWFMALNDGRGLAGWELEICGGDTIQVVND